MVPDVGSRVQKCQERQKVNHDQGVKVHLFKVGDAVFVKNVNGSPKWIPGQVIGSFVRNFHIGFDPDYKCH